MIWYILYPFRGTTEPPRLLPSHPLRRAFQTHGTATARHWLLSILLTIFISALLCYPAIFQTDSPAAAGLRNLPKHVWTSTTEIEGQKPAHVEVRQVWIHGDYMKAIDPQVLQEALRVQDALIGNGFDEDDGSVSTDQNSSTNENACFVTKPGSYWGFHSPLMYWDCSHEALKKDSDLLSTINSRSGQYSALNLTLRPSTVFAGKIFSNAKLRAADALVITLFDQTNSSLEATWNSRTRSLAAKLSSQWSIFPKDGQIVRSRLYEVRFKPMTLNDDLLLAASYFVTAAYVIWRMTQLRAIKSWFGLLVTICAKMTVCIVASFTVCTFIGVNLDRIPRPWFPGVVFCFGLGNIFRLINVVLETPPEMPPHQRIGNAIGEVGHLSLAVAVQNLVLIYLCSRIVTPWVADFCVFAAVTLVLDFVFHLTFFLAVLSVDVQRIELSDSLKQVELTQITITRTQERQSWLDALRRGDLPVSTRFAGSEGIFSIILALNWHFFDSGGQPFSLKGLWGKLLLQPPRSPEDILWISNPLINQARRPADWLRTQDHNTARELLGFIKPNAHSFIARVYDPLLVVLNGADGRDISPKSPSLLQSARHFSHNHAFPAALMVVFLIAGVTLLMNHLLWTGLPEATEDEDDEEALFSVRTLPTTQTLDIVRLATCPKGHLVSISLDRSTSIWLPDRGKVYSQITLQTAETNPKLWPIVACAVDDGGSILALCTDSGQIGLWTLVGSRFLHFPTVELRGQVPILFSFTHTHTTDYDKLSLVIVKPDGHLMEVDIRTGVHRVKRICNNTILCATLYTRPKEEVSLVYVNKLGEVHILSLKLESQWISEVVAGLDPGLPPGSNPSKIKCIQGVPTLGLIFALRAEEAEMFDFHSRAIIHAFQIGRVKPHSFRIMHSPPRQCPCGAPSVHSIAVAYTEQDTNHMILQAFTLNENSTSFICLGKPSDNGSYNCQGLNLATEAVHCVEPAGVWESTEVPSIIGIRKCIQSPTPSSSASGVDNGTFSADPTVTTSALKFRSTRGENVTSLFTSLDSAFTTRNFPPSSTDSDSWEAWTLSSAGEFHSKPLMSSNNPEDEQCIDEQLFVASPGPITRLGNKSVAVSFGNTVKVITLGKESFDSMMGVEDPAMDMNVGSYNWRARRGTVRKLQ
ncbi:hypothetical protein K504DRAFT_459133 [Pleomassaria siparia CBS 279.74]|uniref:Sterol regulatory element-binding protein cleavage-activating protein n=1 Tax=Pleomassaria siparia CBS 279.74 TaxID=1314801 RepID=A0A6G1K1J5_9PLEO|nr:hypothetical protein K504DRAFT_459133 [Pleomassaria siparia CBS 279.74]